MAKERTVTVLLVIWRVLFCVLIVMGFAFWQNGRDNARQRQIIADMQRDDEGYIATVQQIAAERDANLAEVGRLQTLLDTSQDDRARLLSELAQMQTERDLYRDAFNAAIGETPVLDEGEEAIIWCLDAGVVIGYVDECVEMYLTPYP